MANAPHESQSKVRLEVPVVRRADVEHRQQRRDQDEHRVLPKRFSWAYPTEKSVPVRNERLITRTRTGTENDSDAHRRAKPKAQDVVGSMGASSVFSRKRSGTKSCGSYGPSFANAIALRKV